MQVVGYIACLLIGVSLGSIGAGGSILTVPVMVYLFHVPVIVATSYSLFIVGLTSLLGAAVNYRQANTNVRAAGLFCFVSAGGVLVIRSWLLPLIPARLFLFYGFQVTWALVSMLLFATLIFLSASAMIRRGEGKVSGVVGDGGIVGDGVMEGGGIVGGDRVMEGGGTVGGDGVMEGGGLGGDDRPR